MRKRSAFLVWLDKDLALFALPGSSPGRPADVSDDVVHFCLTIIVLFKLVATGAPLKGWIAPLLEVRRQPHNGALRRRDQEPSTPSMADNGSPQNETVRATRH